MSINWRAAALCSFVVASLIVTGCTHLGGFGRNDSCDDDDDAGDFEADEFGSAGAGCRNALCGWCYRRSGAIPQTLPLGSTVRAHYQVMQTNGEAADFIFHRHDFIGQTAELTPDGKDHLLEIAARLRSAPFPVIIERTENNADPELDAHRRNLIARILTDLGNPDAEYRTFVAPAYGPGYNAIQAEPMYYRHVGVGGGIGNFGSFGNNFGTFGGFAGGPGGAIGVGP